jgi:hypothetical protein
MVVEHWLAAFEVTDAASLTNTQARDVLAFLQRHATRFATVAELRGDATRDLIVVDILTGSPQAPVYPILKRERIGILFSGDDRLPSVVMLRDTFPDTEHQQIVPEGHPFVICIDDRPWSEARLTWTPAELVDRITWWFRRAARGELQDARQTLDPILMGSGLSFIMARSILDAGGAHDLVGEYEPTFKNMLRVRRRTEVGRLAPGMEPVTVMAYRIPPQRMERMRRAPGDLAGLATWLNNRGIDLLADLRTRLAEALDNGTAAAWQLHGRAAVIVEIPIQSPRDDGGIGVDMRAFLTSRSAGDIAVSLGIALKQEDLSEGSRVGYVKATLRDLEAQYHGLLLRTARLAEHLGKRAQTVAYTGACRAITNQIPASRAAILSGLAGIGISSIVDGPDGAILVWSLSASGEVTLDAPALEAVSRYRVKGWTITIDVGVIRRMYAIRQIKLPCETGGILFGLVDIPAKQIHLVDATSAPLRPVRFNATSVVMRASRSQARNRS